MAHHVLEPDFIGSAREVLKKALDCLDKIGLHGAAAHIDMARCAFEMHVANVSEYAALPISAHDEAHVEFERLLDAYDAPIGMARG